MSLALVHNALKPAFRPNAVSTDGGNAHLYSLGAGDGSTVTIGQMSGFFYVNPEYTGSDQYIFGMTFTSGQSLYVYIDKAGVVFARYVNAATEDYYMFSLDGVAFSSWNSVMFALDSSGDNFNCMSVNGGNPNNFVYGGAAFSELGTNTYDVGICDVGMAIPSGNGLVGRISQLWINAYNTNGFGEDNYYPQGFMVTSTGMPRNLGPLGNATLLDKPTFYFPNDAANYYLNNGQGSPVEFDIWNSFLDVGPPTGYLT